MEHRTVVSDMNSVVWEALMGRPRGSSTYADADRELIAQMKKMLEAGEVATITQAARTVLSQAAGQNTEPESIMKRLIRGLRAHAGVFVRDRRVFVRGHDGGESDSNHPMIDATKTAERDLVFAEVEALNGVDRDELVAELAARRVLCERQGHAIELLIDAIERRLPAAETALGINDGAAAPVTKH